LETPDTLVAEEIAGVAPEIVSKVLSKTATKLAREVEKVRAYIDRIRGAIESRRGLDTFLIGRAGDYDRLCYASIDSSFTAPAIELVGGYLGIIAVVTVFYGSRCARDSRGGVGAEVFTELWFNRDRVNDFAKYYERSAAVRLLEMKRRGEAYFDVLLVDGEIIPRFLGKAAADPVKKKLVDIAGRMLELADETDTAVVGVLKRSYSRDLVNILGLHDLRLSDRAVMSLVLEPGEYLVVGSYSYLHQELEKLRNMPDVDKNWLNARLEWCEGLLRNIPSGYNVKLAFYRALKTLYPTATKVEYVTSDSLHEDSLLSNLVKISTATGLPAPIDEADRLATATLTKEVRQTAYQKLVAEVAKNVGSSARDILPLLSLTNPEKLGPIL